MKSLSFAVALSIFGALSLPVFAAVSTYKKELCLTQSGTLSIKNVPSVTLALTLPSVTITTTSTTSLTTTITPLPTTSTVTSTSTYVTTTTQSQNTLTGTSTSTITSTETDSTTMTSTSTSSTVTVTTSSATSTVPTVSGFTPLASNTAIVAAGGASKHKRFAHDKSGAHLPMKVTPNGLQCSKKLYPIAVECQEIIKVVATKTVTVTAKTAATVNAPTPISTTSTTTTITSTSTVIHPAATTTTTVFSTSVTTTTSTEIDSTTVTSTSTSTAYAATATVYNQCLSNNIVNYVDGDPIIEVDLENGILGQSSSTDAPTCCIQCAQTSGCGGFAFTGGYCFLINDSDNGATCNPAVASFEFESESNGGPPITVGNGQCGQGTFGGAD